MNVFRRVDHREGKADSVEEDGISSLFSAGLRKWKVGIELRGLKS